jgi:hypothetical protein
MTVNTLFNEVLILAQVCYTEYLTKFSNSHRIMKFISKSITLKPFFAETKITNRYNMPIMYVLLYSCRILLCKMSRAYDSSLMHSCNYNML